MTNIGQTPQMVTSSASPPCSRQTYKVCVETLVLCAVGSMRPRLRGTKTSTSANGARARAAWHQYTVRNEPLLAV